MTNTTPRRQQRFSNYQRALAQLKQAVDTYDESAESIIKQRVKPRTFSAGISAHCRLRQLTIA